VPINPVQLLSKDDKRLPKDPPAMKVWTEDQVIQFLKYMAAHDYPAYVAYQTFLNTGERPSELRGLCREQFDHHNSKLSINRQYSQSEKGIVGRCKAGSHRVIDLPPSLVKILWSYCGDWHPKERLFPFVNNNFLWKQRQEWMRAAGVPVIRNHDFRHTVAVQVYRDGMRRGDPDIVAKLSRLLGHKSIAQTFHYLEGLLDLQQGNDAASSLNWGHIDDDFAVKAASRDVQRVHGIVDVVSPSAVAQDNETITPYPIPIGRPRKGKNAVPKSEHPRTLHAQSGTPETN
jgi:integrase